MKNSTKILSAAFALILISLCFYDFQLKAAYLKRDYKKPFGDFVPANYSGFNSIQLESGTAINLMVVKGPYKVLVDPLTADFVKLSQKGNKLIIQAAFVDHYRSRNHDYTVFISCPDLAAFTSDARYKVEDRVVVDREANIFEKQPTLISGFELNTFSLIEDNGSNIRLENDHIAQLKATIGISNQSHSILNIGTGNSFNAANLEILNKSTLNIEAASGNNTSYHLADSATMTITGAITKQLLKTTQP